MGFARCLSILKTNFNLRKGFLLEREFQTLQPRGGETSRTEKFFKFLQSEKGKKALLGGAVFCSLGTIAVRLAPETPPAMKYVQMFFQTYYSPTEVCPVTQVFGKDIVDNVVQDLSLSIDEAKKLKIFVGNLGEPLAWGSFFLGSVLIGYPYFFNCFTQNELPDMLKVKFGIKVGDDVPEVSKIRSREAKTFRESLLISNEAKKFAIAREIISASDNPVVIPSTLSGSFVFLTYATCRYVNVAIPFLSKRVGQRFSAYIGVASLFYIFHKKLLDFFDNRRIRNADFKAACLSVEYKKGGVEYYEKLLKRNAALRELIPHGKGKKLFNLKGNPVSPLFGSKLTLSQRKRLIEEVKI